MEGYWFVLVTQPKTRPPLFGNVILQPYMEAFLLIKFLAFLYLQTVILNTLRSFSF